MSVDHLALSLSIRSSAYPVCEPLLVVVLSGRLDSLDGEVSGESPTDKIGDRGGEAEHVEEDQNDGSDHQPDV